MRWSFPGAALLPTLLGESGLHAAKPRAARHGCEAARLPVYGGMIRRLHVRAPAKTRFVVTAVVVPCSAKEVCLSNRQGEA
jgi:hypothetical protein